MLSECQVIFSKASVEARLQTLGLELEPLITVGERVLSEWLSVTSNDAATAGGLKAYLAVVRALRDELAHLGWRVYREGGLEFVAHPDNKLLILPGSGDSFTGKEKFSPKSKYPKGPQTCNAVRQNQLSLFPGTEFEKDLAVNRPVWIFLYYFDVLQEEMRMELSLPYRTDERGYLVEWSERLILPAIAFIRTDSDTDADEKVLITEDEVLVEVQK